MDLRRASAVGLLLGALGAALVAAPAEAQDARANLDKVFDSLSGSCKAVRTEVQLLREDPGRKTPAERVAKLEQYRECLVEARATGGRGPEEMVALEAEGEKSRGEKQAADADTSFRGVSFGVGMGFSFSGSEIVPEAAVAADGNLRAVRRYRQQPRVILESHYYGLCGAKKCKAGTLGIGPFFGIVARNDQLISGFALGAMIGWKQAQAPSSEGFSVGLGAILDDDVKSLAPGFAVGRPLPAGEAEPRYESKPRWSGILFCSRTF